MESLNNKTEEQLSFFDIKEIIKLKNDKKDEEYETAKKEKPEGLTNSQSISYDKAIDWWYGKGEYKNKYKPFFRIGGSAGTGKSFFIDKLVKAFNLKPDNVKFIAFTGNAAVNMIVKGNPNASTLHKLIYHSDAEEEKIFKDKKRKVIDEETGEEKIVIDKELVKVKKEIKVVKKSHLDEPDIKLIILDEYSMVDNKMLEDLFSFNIPVILIGDKKQLPPVKKSNDYMDSYEAELTEIVRQNEDSVLISAFNRINNYEALPYGVYGKNELVVLPKYMLDEDNEDSDSILTKIDQIIVAKNNTRKKVNQRVRKILGFDTGEPFDYLPKVGDKIVCCKNQWDVTTWSPLLQQFVPLVNGTIGYVDSINFTSLTNKRMSINFHPSFDPECKFENIIITFENFDDKFIVGTSGKNEGVFDFGYAITCHKSQGNQYKSVLVFPEKLFFNRKIKGGFNIDMEVRWMYTAASRAMKKLWIAVDPSYYSSDVYIKTDEYWDSLENYYEIT